MLEQHCHNLLTSLLQVRWRNILLTSCLKNWQACYKPVEETSCWQDIGTALSQLVNKPATSLLKTYLVENILYLVEKSLEQHCHNLLTSLLQVCWRDILLTSCWNGIVTALVNKLARSLSRRHLVDKLLEHHCRNLLTSVLQACWGDILLTSCWNSIVATCQQSCYKPVEEISCWQVVGTALSQLIMIYFVCVLMLC
jgi:hypothetical protein